MFRNCIVEIDSVEKDITNDGELSCAFFVSSVLMLFRFIESSHATVDGLIFDLEKSGWENVSERTPGAIIVWEELVDEKGAPHKHIGFVLEGDEVISNSSSQRVPTKHHFTYGTEKPRKVTHIYRQKSGSGAI
jgi:hypothetical protein